MPLVLVEREGATSVVDISHGCISSHKNAGLPRNFSSCLQDSCAQAQKRRNPHSEDAPGVRSRLGLTKHPRRPNTGAGATPATGDPNAPVPMMPTAFDMDTAPSLCVTDTIQPLSSQIPVLSQTPAATPSASEAQTSTQQLKVRNSPDTPGSSPAYTTYMLKGEKPLNVPAAKNTDPGPTSAATAELSFGVLTAARHSHLNKRHPRNLTNANNIVSCVTSTITLRPLQTVRGKVLIYHAAAQLPKIQPKHRNTLSPAQPQKPGRRYQAQLCTRRIVSRHCRTLVRPAPSTVTTAVVAAEVPEQAEAEVGIEDHHDRRSQAPTIRRLLLPPARSLKLLQATTENHRMPQAQRGDPQEDIKDPRNRLRGQAPHHHIKSYGGTNTTANLQLTRTNSLQTHWLSSLLMDIKIPVTILPWATPGPPLRPQHQGVPIPPRVGLTFICRQWTTENDIRNEGPA
ncbi:hypothetical protein HPB52_002840 [Rhipicephalus sanguineus]|uniref:Uncharacterized protein n=1 Tax=Rhipicephalus sanguineus TaxID=34632 RepID=A0A9D4PA65_RHISA|nr:hypothetical protein HPB52_002840 [Rhipicephalus sanguineus]